MSLASRAGLRPIKKVLLILLVLAELGFAAGNWQSAVSKGEFAGTGESGQVSYVTDGDTVKVNVGGINYNVRLVGIDTPEVKDPRRPVQCFGREASNKTKELLLNKKVVLEYDPVAGDKDKYGRLLRYVFLEDGTNINRRLIADGYAYEYTYEGQLYKYRDEFKLAEKQARAEKRGLWADDACAGIASPVQY